MSKSDVTMKDVADAAGVSNMTVSRALKPSSPISEKTRQHVLKIAQEMNYVPDQLASSLSSKRSGFVAVLVPSLKNIHFADTVQALSHELENSELQILLGYTEYDKSREEKLIETMLRRRPEAIILSYDGHSKRTVELLKGIKIPIIQIWERPKDPILHTIGFSNEKAAYNLTSGLIKKGYKNIIFLSEQGLKWTQGAAKRRGFKKAMSAYQLDQNRIIEVGKAPISIADGYAALPLIKEKYPDTDCVICVSDLPAFGLLSALKQEGLKTAEEFGVAGFGNFEVSRFSSPSITTVAVDSKRIGEAAGSLTSQLINSEKKHNERFQIDVQTSVIFRESTKR